MKSKKNITNSRVGKKTKKPTVKTLLGMYWIHLTIITVIVGYGINRQLELRQFAQNCMTRAMVASDARCLYIYQNQVYEKDSRNKPHKSTPCGTDVTSIIPSFHFMSAAKYLDPNLVGSLCSDTQPTPIPTSKPTNTPTNKPLPTATPTTRPLPTNTPIIVPSATQTPRPTNTPFVTSTPNPTQVPSTPTTIPTPTEILLPTPTPTLPPITTYPGWWNLIPSPLRNYLEQLYYWVFYFRRASDNAHVLEGVFPTPTP